MILTFALIFGSLTSCMSSKVDVPLDASAREIVQMAQTAFDEGHSKKSINYYQVLLQRYGMDTAIYIEGRYETAHIYVKEKKYAEAEPLLNEVLEIYGSSQPGMLPGSFRKLAENDMKKIQEAKK